MRSTSTPAAAVGFVGLGTMGAPMAARLRAAGVPVVVHNRDRAKAEPLLASGASWADSPRALAREATAGVVFVMVSDGRAVRAVVFGRHGVAAGAPPGALVVNLSTIAPEESRAISERLGRRGLRYLEAPVGGSRDAAARGELLVFAGGSASDLETARPYLARFASSVELVGPVGMGMAMKLVNNLVTVTTVAVDAEAIAFAEALGLDPTRTVDLLLAGAGASRMLSNKREAFAQGSYPVQFRLALAEKDLRLIGQAAREVGSRTPIAREARRLAQEALRAGLGDQDLAVLLEAARRRGRAPEGRPAVDAGSPPPTGPGGTSG